MASFGEELKRERELRDISLKEIAEATKISLRFLEALEQNNFDVLPGGVFNRGFIRAYARFIGVDGEEMVNAYLHEVALREARQTQAAKGPQRPTAPAGAGATEAPAARAESRAPSRIESRLGGRGEARVEIPPEKRFSPRAAREATEGRTSIALWVLVVLAFLVGVGVIMMSLVGGKPADASAEGHAQVARTRSIRQDTGPAATPVEVAGAPKEPPASAPSVPPTGATEAGVAEDPPVPGHHLRVRVLEVTRVTIECAGKRTLDQELWPGQSRSLTCAEPVVLSAGNGGAVEYSLDNSPPTLLGDVGQQIDGLTVAPAGQESKDSDAGR